MSEEWGPWIEHDGNGCTCIGMRVQVMFNDRANTVRESVAIGSPAAWVWSFESFKWAKVIRYRIRRPRALLQLIHMVENLPAHKPTYEDA